MSAWGTLWARLTGRASGAPSDGSSEKSGEPSRVWDVAAEPRSRAQSSARADARAPRDEIEQLGVVGAKEGPGALDAIAILRRARGTSREADAVTAVLGAAAARTIPPAVAVAAAEILATRGARAEALALLDGTTEPQGLVLAADLHAACGQVARAVSTIERLLAREIDAPGAMERRARWRASLGAAPEPPARSDAPTVVSAAAASAPFRLLREVARGGAGVVYEAEDAALGRRLAFKAYHRGPEDGAVVLREARLAVRFAGPGVVRVLDADPAEGWVALEWIARGSVREALRSGDLAALLPALGWAAPLARALARVHAGGCVHGDVKPANVLLRAAGDPVLGDFGLARSIGAPSGGGSAGYVSPERLAGGESDPRDDVYGYGRILEDVLVRLDNAAREGRLPADELRGLGPLRALAARCVRAADERPRSGDDLVRALAEG